jgi:membrane protein YqaA with SNARE-associated domain
VFLLGFIDSAGIPVAVGMDAMVILLAVKAPERAWFCAAMAVVGSVAGNMALYYAARRGGRRFVPVVPQPGKPQRFRAWFDRYGLLTVFIPATVPIPLPLKVFVVSAGVLRTPARPFVAVIVLARVLRYFGEAWLGITLGQHSMGFLKQYAWYMAGASLLLFLAMYGLIRLSDVYRQRV